MENENFLNRFTKIKDKKKINLISTNRVELEMVLNEEKTQFDKSQIKIENEEVPT